MPNLADAITAAETAATKYTAAAQTVIADEDAVTMQKAKLDTATAQVATDSQTQADAATALNGALDDLIAAATASKIPPAVTP